MMAKPGLPPRPGCLYDFATMGPLAVIRYLHRAWKARRRNERAEIAALQRLVRPGSVALDIGAHKGSYLFWLRRAVGPSGKVLAFEPQPLLAAYLQDLTRTFRWRNVEVRHQGISDNPGELTLHVPGAAGVISPGASFEASVTDHGPSHSVRVKVTSLDFEFPAGSPRPSFIKCDVEGHELAVFEGGASLLATQGPALLFECEARHLGGRPVSDVFAILAKLGYSGEFFSLDGLRPVSEFRPDIHQSENGVRFWDRHDYCNNFLFTKPKRN